MVAVIAAVVIEVLLLVLVGMADSVIGTIVILQLAHAVYLVAVHHVLKNGCRQLTIIAAALLFRITLAPLPSPSSYDVNRYRWEALVQQSGGNPYDVRPADPDWAHLRDSTFSGVPAKDFKAGYGPAWELLSFCLLKLIRLWTGDPQSQLLWWKLPAALFDLGTIAALATLLRSRRFPSSRVLIYAWCPLPVWEFWGNGHNDAMVLFFLVSALALHARWRMVSEVVLGVAVAVKWWPAILLPAFAWRSRSVRPFLIAAAVLATFAVPYLTDVSENAQFMTGFVGGWRNNDSLFGVLLFLTGDLYRAKYLAFTLLAVAALWLASRNWPIERIALWTIVILLLLSANCHPWYLTWIIPLLAIYPYASLLLWVSLAPLAYSVLIKWQILRVWDGSTTERWWIYGPVFLWLGWDLLQKRLAKTMGYSGKLA